jgi:hypothetical protein
VAWSGQLRDVLDLPRLRVLDFLHGLEGGPDLDVDALHAEASRVEADVARLRVPLKYSREPYVLRAHVRMVREGLPEHSRARA